MKSSDKWEEENKIKNCCPVCGSEFDLATLNDSFSCDSCNVPDSSNLTKDRLIGCWDDYLWVQ